MPWHRVELQVDPLPARHELHLRLIYDHHRLEGFRVADEAEHRALGECGTDVSLPEDMTTPSWEPAGSVRGLFDGRGREHDAATRGGEYEIRPVLPLPAELLLDALERFLDRADLEAGGGIGEAFPFEARQSRLRLGCLPVEVGNCQIEVDARQPGDLGAGLDHHARLDRDALEDAGDGDVHRLLCPGTQFSGTPHPLRERNERHGRREGGGDDSRGDKVTDLHFLTPPGNIEKLDDVLNRPDDEPPQGSHGEHLP